MALAPLTSVGGGVTELGYDQITAAVTVSATVEASGTTVIACAAHTFDGSAVIADFFTPFILPGANDFVIVSLFEGATQIGRLLTAQSGQTTTPVPVQNNCYPCVGRIRFTPTAASHTYTVTAIRSAANGTIAAGAGGTGVAEPAYIRFTTAA